MFTYQCLFCGGIYHTPRAMDSCTICGQTTTSGWLREAPRERAVEQPKLMPALPNRPSTLKVAA